MLTLWKDWGSICMFWPYYQTSGSYVIVIRVSWEYSVSVQFSDHLSLNSLNLTVDTKRWIYAKWRTRLCLTRSILLESIQSKFKRMYLITPLWDDKRFFYKEIGCSIVTSRVKGTPGIGGPPGQPVFRSSLSTGPNCVIWPIPQQSFLLAGLRNVGLNNYPVRIKDIL